MTQASKDKTELEWTVCDVKTGNMLVGFRGLRPLFADNRNAPIWLHRRDAEAMLKQLTQWDPARKLELMGRKTLTAEKVTT